MKVTSVIALTEKFPECDLTTTNQNFYVKANDTYVLVHNSPALVFGWQGKTFVLTDKAGFSAKTYDGMTTSPDSIVQMIMARKIKDTSNVAIQQRLRYAQKIASLYNLLRDSTPKTLKGFAQGDLLYVGRPPIIDGSFVFQPNKITYRVPTASHLGEMIDKSQAGLVIHSIYSSQNDEEPDPLRDVLQLGFRTDLGLAILPHEATMLTKLSLSTHLEKHLHHEFRFHAQAVRRFLDVSSLTEAGIKTLPTLMKTYLAKRAELGQTPSPHVAREFLDWLTSPNSKTSVQMKSKCIDWIQKHLYGYNATWRISNRLAELKLNLKQQMDQQAGGTIEAHLTNTPGHEGFVSVTPHGMVKFVNRTQFMRKAAAAQPLKESVVKKVAFAYGRLNPPTIGHQHLATELEKFANGGDYWIFLSQSHDKKKNPLDWETKLEFLNQILEPRHRAHLYTHSDIRTIVQAMDWLYNQGYRDITFVGGSDRVDPQSDETMVTLLNNWNSPEIREKYNRDPVELRFESAGKRKAGAKGVEGISSTDARKAALADDFEKFQEAVGLEDQLARELFSKTKQGLGAKKAVKESVEHPHGTIVMLKMCEDSAKQLESWCRSNNVPCISPEDLHMTVLYSRNPVPHLTSMHGNTVTVPASVTGWTKLGDKALCLSLECPLAHRFHQSLRAQGGTHDWEEYVPHSSVSYDWMERSDLPSVLPDFPLLFNKIHVSEIDPSYRVSSS